MKFKVGDKVLVTAGKDKGMKSVITQVLPQQERVVVEGANQYVKHVKPMPMINRPGDRIIQTRPLPTAKVAILNDKGEPDRIGYEIREKGNQTEKVRVFKKTGEVINYQAEAEAESKTESKSKTTKKESKKSKK